MPDIVVDTDRTGGNRRQLDSAPPQPPRQGKSLMAMADGGQGPTNVDMSSLPVRIMSKMGDIRRDLMEFSTLLPPLAQGLQQILSGLEQVVPQMVADVVAGNPPGSGGSGMGAPQANAAPAAPPVQGGMQ